MGLAEGVRSHQGDHLGKSIYLSINRLFIEQVLAHLPAGHTEGVAEELDGRLSVPNRIGVDLCLQRLVRELWVSLESGIGNAWISTIISPQHSQLVQSGT